MERLASLVLKFCFILTFFCYTFANILNYSRPSGEKYRCFTDEKYFFESPIDCTCRLGS